MNSDANTFAFKVKSIGILQLQKSMIPSTPTMNATISRRQCKTYVNTKQNSMDSLAFPWKVMQKPMVLNENP